MSPAKSLTVTYSDGSETTGLWYIKDEEIRLNNSTKKVIDAVDEKALRYVSEAGMKGMGGLYIIQRRDLILLVGLEPGGQAVEVEAAVLNKGEDLRYNLPNPCVPHIELISNEELIYLDPKAPEVCI